MNTLGLNFDIKQANVQFKQSNAETKLFVLLGSAKQLYEDNRATTSGALFSQKVQCILKELQQIPKNERQEALQEIVTGAQTRLTEAYEKLDTNMKMVFWYRLTDNLQGNSLLSKPFSQNLISNQERLLSELVTRDSNELLSFLRAAVETDQVRS